MNYEFPVILCFTRDPFIKILLTIRGLRVNPAMT